MNIAIVENNQVTRLGDYRKIFPNVSFASSGPDASFLLSNSAFLVAEWKEYDPNTQKLVSVHPYYEDGMVYTVEVLDKTESDIAEETLLEATNVRNKRNQLLAESDWTQVYDTPVDRDAWGLYRQELRDITSQEGFPFNVIWPAKPQ